MSANKALTGWIFAKTPAGCARLCDAKSGCKGFTVERWEGYCKLYDNCSYQGSWSGHDSYKKK